VRRSERQLCTRHRRFDEEVNLAMKRPSHQAVGTLYVDGIQAALGLTTLLGMSAFSSTSHAAYNCGMGWAAYAVTYGVRCVQFVPAEGGRPKGMSFTKKALIVAASTGTSRRSFRVAAFSRR
jgi:hypothetical protein